MAHQPTRTGESSRDKPGTNTIRSHAQVASLKPRNRGGRPPHRHVKLVLYTLMRQLRVADVHRVRLSYTQHTGKPSNYHTIKKYLDQLVQDGVLRREVASDNQVSVRSGRCQQRRRLHFYWFD